MPASVERIGTLALVCVTWLVLFLTLFGSWHYWSKEPVRGPMPAKYPIVAMADGRAGIVWGADLEPFKQQHPDYCFLVPIEQLEPLREELASQTRSHQQPIGIELDPDAPWDAWFEVKQLDSGRQAVMVDASNDDDRENVGWYEATAQEIHPQYYRHYFGPGRVIVVAAGATILTVIAIIGAGMTMEVRTRRRMQRGGGAELAVAPDAAPPRVH